MRIAFASISLAACAGTSGIVLSQPPGDSQNRLSHDVIGIAAGYQHSCALNRDGSIACWGFDPESWGTTTPPYGSFVQIRGAADHTCALASDGTVACWGFSDEIADIPPGRFSEISTFSDGNCGIRAEGTLACWAGTRPGATAAPAGTFVDLSGAIPHACAIAADGSLACWGVPDYTPVPPAGAYARLSTSGGGDCAIRQDDGTVVCFPSGDLTQEGSTAAPQPPPGRFVSLAASNEGYTCGIRDDATLACWGDPGEIGVPPGGHYIAVALEWWHACAVRDDGAVVCWGRDLGGETVPPAPSY